MSDIVGFVVVVLLIILPLALYWSGIGGPFLLDDFYNLSPMVHIDNIGGLDGVFYYLASNTSGVLGRPVALISFLLNDYTWPSSPESFKYTNIMLHVLCGLSLFWMIWLLCRHSRVPSKASIIIAGFTALAWVAHPINVSTTLYVVQRMTILAAIFSILALISFIYAFSEKRSPVKVHIFIAFFGLFSVLSILSKESGALVAIQALLIGYLVFDGGRRSLSPCRGYYKVLMAGPIMLIGYLAYKWPSFIAGYEWRSFSLIERLLTQARLLVDYMGSILLPSRVRGTLYFDDYPVSTGLLDPVSTAFSLAFIVVLIGLLVYLAFRKKLVFVVLGGGWFFIGHLLESTVIPLEIAFEHRNYLPSMGILFAIVYGGWRLTSNLDSRFARQLVALASIGTVSIVSLLTSQHVHAWSDRAQLIFTWSIAQPNSQRAQLEFVEIVAAHGQPYKAIEILDDFSHRNPNRLSVVIRQEVMQCKYWGYTDADLYSYDVGALKISRGALIGEVERYMDVARQHHCSEIDTQRIRRLISSIKAHEDVAKDKRLMVRLLDIEATYESEIGNSSRSLSLLDEASVYQRTVDIPLKQAVIAFKSKMYDKSLFYIEKGLRLNNDRNRGYPSRRDELEKLRDLVMEKKGSQDG